MKKSITSIYNKQSFDPEIIYNYVKGKIKFKGICLKQDSVYFIHRNVVNLYISFELDTWSRDSNTDFTLDHCLFGVVKLTKNANPHKYEYSGYGIRFDIHSDISLPDSSWGKIIVTFGADISSSVHFDNKKKRIS